MRPKHLSIVCLLAAGAAALAWSGAPAAPRHPTLAALGGRQVAGSAGGVSWIGLRTEPVAGGPRVAAEAFLNLHLAELGLSSRRDLSFVAVRPTALGAAVVYQERLTGLPVLGARVHIAVDKAGRVRAASSTARPLSAPARVTWLSPEEAVQRAVEDFVARQELLVFPAVGPRGQAHRALLPVGNEARPVYVVRLRSLDPLKNWQVTVDGESGKVLARRNLVFKLTSPPGANQALVWLESPGVYGTEPRTLVELPDLAESDSDMDGALDGNLIESLNCCRYVGCDPVSRTRRYITGSIPNPFSPSTKINFQVAWCNEVQRASNTRDGRSDYVYPLPADLSTLEPSGYYAYRAGQPASADDPRMSEGESDVVAEVMNYWHAREQYGYFRAIGDPNLVLRDTAEFGRPLYVSGNYLAPDYIGAQVAFSSFNLNAIQNALKTAVRVNNAAFVPRGTFLDQIEAFGASVEDGISERFNRDSIIMFQGAADFAWDGDVIRHEFGHAAIWTVAEPLVDAFVADAWGVFVAPGAMNEGYADYFALAALDTDAVQANYVGPRVEENPEVGIRSLDNAYACPTVIENEVHQDSQHFSAALWQIRAELGGNDAGSELAIDQAIYDGMVNGGAVASFEAYGEATVSSLAARLGEGPAARAREIFEARGVIGCERSIELVDGASDGPRVWQHFGRTPGAFANYAPGPTQYHVALPPGASRVELSITQDVPLASCTASGGTPDTNLRMHWVKGSPIVFTYAGENVSSSATQSVDVSSASGRTQDISCNGQRNVWYGATRTWSIDLSSQGSNCVASTLHMALVNYAESGTAYEKVRARVVVDAAAAAACGVADAGPADAGPSGEDAGPILTPDAGPIQTADSGPVDPGGSGGDAGAEEGCGCGGPRGAAPLALAFALLGLGLLRRRVL